MESATVDREQISCNRHVVTRDWDAWINAMPPGPSVLIVRGEVEVPNPGVEAVLCRKVPQGINEKILLLDLYLIQKPGIWPQLVTWTTARYVEEAKVGAFTDVSILSDGEIIAEIPVHVVS